MYKAKIYITLKPTVLDAQGAVVEKALKALGYETVSGLRIGKYIEASLDGGSRSEAERQVNEMCQKLLANPIIESYRFDLEKS